MSKIIIFGLYWKERPELSKEISVAMNQADDLFSQDLTEEQAIEKLLQLDKNEVYHDGKYTTLGKPDFVTPIIF